MRDREFRELQVSSTQLAIIFLGILIIGVVVFLLGVSVGKKHAQVVGATTLLTQKEAEPLKEKIVLPKQKPDLKTAGQEAKEKEGPSSKAETPAGTPSDKIPVVSQTNAQEQSKPAVETQARAGQPETKTQAPRTMKILYYVQVGALAERQAALAAAQRYRTQGYSVVVLDPFPTDRNPVYRVRIGGYSTKEEAEVARTKLTAAAGKKTDFFIVRY